RACLSISRSPWPPPLSPPTPLPVVRLCSSASQLLWRGQTSHDRASSATAPRLPDADQRSTCTLTASRLLCSQSWKIGCDYLASRLVYVEESTPLRRASCRQRTLGHQSSGLVRQGGSD